jgi:malonyl-CoA O-methyltransferase
VSGLDRRAIRRAFSRAARHYEQSAVLQREVETRLLERVVYLTAPPRRVLDLGTGPGRAAGLLKRRYRSAQVIALDPALSMLRLARRRGGWFRPIPAVCGEAESLPLADASVDLLFSNLCLQWCEDLGRVLDECRRVLAPRGLLLLSTFGPDTLRELRAAWAEGDAAPHVSHCPDLPVLGDALLAAGLRDPVVDRETFTLEYADARALMRDLKNIGAGNADVERRRGLTGKQRFARAVAGYEQFRVEGKLPATYEVVYAQAFGPEPGQPRRGASGDIAAIGVDALRANLRRR